MRTWLKLNRVAWLRSDWRARETASALRSKRAPGASGASGPEPVTGSMPIVRAAPDNRRSIVRRKPGSIGDPERCPIVAATPDGDDDAAPEAALRWIALRRAAQAAHSPAGPASPPQAQRRCTDR